MHYGFGNVPPALLCLTPSVLPEEDPEHIHSGLFPELFLPFSLVFQEYSPSPSLNKEDYQEPLRKALQKTEKLWKKLEFGQTAMQGNNPAAAEGAEGQQQRMGQISCQGC